MKKPKHQPDTDNKRNNKIAQRKIHTKELLHIRQQNNHQRINQISFQGLGQEVPENKRKIEKLETASRFTQKENKKTNHSSKFNNRNKMFYP